MNHTNTPPDFDAMMIHLNSDLRPLYVTRGQSLDTCKAVYNAYVACTKDFLRLDPGVEPIYVHGVFTPTNMPSCVISASLTHLQRWSSVIIFFSQTILPQ
jgi:hypothetical protein